MDQSISVTSSARNTVEVSGSGSAALPYLQPLCRRRYQRRQQASLYFCCTKAKAAQVGGSKANPWPGLDTCVEIQSIVILFTGKRAFAAYTRQIPESAGRTCRQPFDDLCEGALRS